MTNKVQFNQHPPIPNVGNEQEGPLSCVLQKLAQQEQILATQAKEIAELKKRVSKRSTADDFLKGAFIGSINMGDPELFSPQVSVESILYSAFTGAL